jgi:farnesyl-diphosphate farnesyltransferase
LALDKVSRSFAAVIRQLPSELRDPVCVFYLVLRGLDSIEDDMNIPPEVKHDLLLRFHEKSYDPNWSVSGMGDTPDYQVLLRNYYKVSRSFLQLDKPYQKVITEVCREMGQGMSVYAEREVRTLEDYDQYCHYVAGLVGIGLSGLFAASGVESPQIAEEKALSNSMGLFLQKTNIIRDYLEDLYSYRTFWPREVWARYAGKLEYFASQPGSPRSVACLNHLVADALRHAPDCLDYLGSIKDPRVFRFCAIPQVMAIATLAEIYNNSDVFRRVVKIRKSLAAKLILDTRSMEDVRKVFSLFGDGLLNRLSLQDPTADELVRQLQRLQHSCGKIENLPIAADHRFSESSRRIKV